MTTNRLHHQWQSQDQWYRRSLSGHQRSGESNVEGWQHTELRYKKMGWSATRHVNIFAWRHLGECVQETAPPTWRAAVFCGIVSTGHKTFQRKRKWVTIDWLKWCDVLWSRKTGTTVSLPGMKKIFPRSSSESSSKNKLKSQWERLGPWTRSWRERETGKKRSRSLSETRKSSKICGKDPKGVSPSGKSQHSVSLYFRMGKVKRNPHVIFDTSIMLQVQHPKVDVYRVESANSVA